MTQRYSNHAVRSRFLRVLVGALIPVALIATVGGADTLPANTLTLAAPSGLPGVAGLPFTGTTTTFTIPSSITSNPNPLVLTPDQGVQGTAFSVKGSGLPANTSVQLAWSTSNGNWLADVEPNTVNYLGASFTNVQVLMGTVTTDATGAFTFATTVPADFGGKHQVYVVANGQALVTAAFYEYRTLTVSPRSGPVGTPITITYTGMGASLYTGGAEVLWDNHYTGEMQAQWTRGTGQVTIRAAGPVGAHFIQVGNAISYMYLNVIQSPIPWTNGGTVKFRVTKDRGPSAPSITWPANVTPTVSEVTTLSAANLDPQSSALATIAPQSGPVLSIATLNVTGLPFNGPATLVWSTVVGNRVNCASTCWAFTTVPLGTATVAGGAITNQKVTVPDNLGGWHVVQVMNGTTVEAQVPFYVKESIVPFYNKAGKVVSMGLATADLRSTPAALAAGQSGVGSRTFKSGQEFTISIKGVGWTQLDNTLGVDYDNSYIGYSCGFNSNGYMVVHLKATGALGTHLIDLYPMLYSLSPSFSNTPYGMVPDLSSGRDFPGLALGYHVPIMHFAITIVK